MSKLLDSQEEDSTTTKSIWESKKKPGIAPIIIALLSNEGFKIGNIWYHKLECKLMLRIMNLSKLFAPLRPMTTVVY